MKSGSMTGKLHNGSVMRPGLACLLTFFLLAALAGVAAPPASAAEPFPAPLWTSPEDEVSGSGAGRIEYSEGVATDPTTGDVYVLDRLNERVVQFTAFGVFVKAWGWGVATGAAELETCGPGATPPTSNCLTGLSGSGPGQLSSQSAMGGITVDADGNVWVGDLSNRRLQKFSPEGVFLLMAGDGVNAGPANPGDICTAANLSEGDDCGAGAEGNADGQFSASNETGDVTEVGPDGSIFIGDKGRIQEFEPDGSFKSSISLQGALSGIRVVGLAIDPAGAFWVSLANSPGIGVHKLDSSGVDLIPPVPAEGINQSLATDAEGNLYVAMLNDHIRHIEVNGEVQEFNPGDISEVVKFDSGGAALIPQGSGFSQTRINDPQGYSRLFGLATNVVSDDSASDLYVASWEVGGTRASLRAYGPPPTKWAPPLHAPEISSQYSLSIEPDSAELGAEINPYFWEDTSYYLEYGTGKCSEGGCTTLVPAPPGLTLDGGVVSEPVPTQGIEVSGLQPGTEYHYRFVALSPGSEGEEVRGVGGKVGDDGEGASFVTPAPPPPPNTACVNQAFRVGPSADLPFCRAYEMVSPVEKNNTDVRSLPNFFGTIAILDQSATNGDKFTYTTSQGMGDAQGVPYLSQYLATRGAGGWSNHGLTPAQGISNVEPGNRLDLEFRAFSDDLCSAVVRTVTDRLLAPGAHSGFTNLYRRQNCGAEGYETLSTLEPPPENASGYNFVPEPQGFSADGQCSVFFYKNSLSQPPKPLYRSCGGDQHLVSVLPNGEPSPAESSAGSATENLVGVRDMSVFQAVSADASRIYWSTAAGSKHNDLYVRMNPNQSESALKLGSAGGRGQLSKGSNLVADLMTTSGAFAVGQTISATYLPEGTKITAVSADSLTLSNPAIGDTIFLNEPGGTRLFASSPCTEPSKACTVRLPSKDKRSYFWGASSDGSKAFYTLTDEILKSELVEFTLATGKATTIATDVLGVVGLGEDATRIAFVSRKALGPGANAEGRIPVAGQPNLYLFDTTRSGSERFRFIGILAPTDARMETASDYSAVAREPYKRLARVSTDGDHVVFVATSRLTGYDNTDAQSGKPDGEVFVYDADADGGEGRLSCVSCNPTGQRPSGRVLRIDGINSPTWAAAFIPSFQTEIFGSRVISDDGSHVFFNSHDRLLQSDTNGKMDVYEWQAPGDDPNEGGCTVESPTYSPPNRGCLALISTGKSSSDSEFLDASPDGRDVFFATQESLVGQDTGLTDVYDARAGGGFPAPPSAPPVCEGEACQPQGAVPSDPAPATSAPAPGNPPATIRCPRGFHKVQKKGVKPKCVKNKKQKQGKGKGKRKSNKSRGAGR